MVDGAEVDMDILTKHIVVTFVACLMIGECSRCCNNGRNLDFS